MKSREKGGRKAGRKSGRGEKPLAGVCHLHKVLREVLRVTFLFGYNCWRLGLVFRLLSFSIVA